MIGGLYRRYPSGHVCDGPDGCVRHPDIVPALKFMSLHRAGSTRPTDVAIVNALASRLLPEQILYLASRLEGRRREDGIGPLPRRAPRLGERDDVLQPVVQPRVFVSAPAPHVEVHVEPTPAPVVHVHTERAASPAVIFNPTEPAEFQVTAPASVDSSLLDKSEAEDRHSWLQKDWDAFLFRWGTDKGWRKGEGEPAERIAKTIFGRR